ncbi:uncharacterized protein LOC126736471 [Anthonomus grandis grandis]|uniref:uncharacterized protein LOC126736471 n=1 Tax=Anthonomus grandis grandis TaxID=2921223 RepID=UPI00216506C2|nr:uncharacterized protein LOC126736471 [Anthonomus grandis grandis]
MDTDKMIQLIQSCPSLWDKGCDEYKNRTIKEKCWTEITVQLNQEEWEELSSADKQKKIADVKLKWKNVRDHFRKTLQGPKSGAAAKKTKYMYADALEFLLSASKKRSTSGNISFDEEEHESQLEGHSETDSSSSQALPIPRPTPPLSPSTSTSTTVYSTSTLPKKPKMSQFQSQLLKTLEKPMPQPEIEPDNSNKLFMMSIVPFMDKLSEGDNLEFRHYVNDFFIQLRRRKRVSVPLGSGSSTSSGTSSPFPVSSASFSNSFVSSSQHTNYIQHPYSDNQTSYHQLQTNTLPSYYTQSLPSNHPSEDELI